MLRLVLPKGSLEAQTLKLFEEADLAVVRSSEVDYKASINDPRVLDVRILRPQEIPLYLAEGMFDLGITGRDWIEERNADVVTLTELHYAKATAQPSRSLHLRKSVHSSGENADEWQDSLRRSKRKAHRLASDGAGAAGGVSGRRGFSRYWSHTESS